MDYLNIGLLLAKLENNELLAKQQKINASEEQFVAPQQTRTETSAEKLIRNMQFQELTPADLKMNCLKSIDRAAYIKEVLNLPKTLPELFFFLKNPENAKIQHELLMKSNLSDDKMQKNASLSNTLMNLPDTVVKDPVMQQLIQQIIKEETPNQNQNLEAEQNQENPQNNSENNSNKNNSGDQNLNNSGTAPQRNNSQDINFKNTIQNTANQGVNQGQNQNTTPVNSASEQWVMSNHATVKDASQQPQPQNQVENQQQVNQQNAQQLQNNQQQPVQQQTQQIQPQNQQIPVQQQNDLPPQVNQPNMAENIQQSVTQQLQQEISQVQTQTLPQNDNPVNTADVPKNNQMQTQVQPQTQQASPQQTSGQENIVQNQTQQIQVQPANQQQTAQQIQMQPQPQVQPQQNNLQIQQNIPKVTETVQTQAQQIQPQVVTPETSVQNQPVQNQTQQIQAQVQPANQQQPQVVQQTQVQPQAQVQSQQNNLQIQQDIPNVTETVQTQAQQLQPQVVTPETPVQNQPVQNQTQQIQVQPQQIQAPINQPQTVQVQPQIQPQPPQIQVQQPQIPSNVQPQTAQIQQPQIQPQMPHNMPINNGNLNPQSPLNQINLFPSNYQQVMINFPDKPVMEYDISMPKTIPSDGGKPTGMAAPVTDSTLKDIQQFILNNMNINAQQITAVNAANSIENKDAMELFLSGLINIHDVGNLLKTNGKHAASAIVLAMAAAAKKGLDTSQLQDTLKFINASVSTAAQDTPAQTLKSLMMLYLPWLPLNSGVGFDLEIETAPGDDNKTLSVLTVLIQTLNYGNLKGLFSLTTSNSVNIHIICSDKFPKDKLIEKLNAETKVYSMQSYIEFEEQKPLKEEEKENRETKVNLSATDELNPYLLLMAHSFIRNTILLDNIAGQISEKTD
ncbi:hypothetical protein IJI31_03800 [bacterium]|nr:hypothetical protein [bacterium]